MTNATIIENARLALVKAEKIQQDEEIHTYKHWKSMGYQVFKGEKAITALMVWTPVPRKKKDDDEEDDKKTAPFMKLKRASFFSSRQVFSLMD